MSRLLNIGLFTEGCTDIRFLESIVKRTFVDISFECFGDIDVEVSVILIDKKDLKFTEQVFEAARKGGVELGIMILCIHVDADDKDDNNVWKHKIEPAQKRLKEQDGECFCKYLVPIIPIYMTESWMLADKELLRRQIGTNKSDVELNIQRDPERIVDPKEVIKDAIRIARQEMTKRRRNSLSISELYLPIGQQIDIVQLDALVSYQKFKEGVRQIYKELNLLH